MADIALFVGIPLLALAAICIVADQRSVRIAALAELVLFAGVAGAFLRLVFAT